MATDTRSARRPRTVADLMHRHVLTIGPDATVAELARMLSRHRISGVPVVAAGGKPVGTVSVTDILWLSDRVIPTREAVRSGDCWVALEARRVREIMTPDVFGVAPGASVQELLEFFSRTGLHRAFVLEEGRVVGMVSVADLLPLLFADDHVPV